MKVVVYENEALVEGATLALEHRLYVKSWLLRGRLVQCLGEGRDCSLKSRIFPQHRSEYKLALGFVGDTPVAVVLWDGDLAMAFCKEFHRRNGYASACFKALNLVNAKARTGIYGSANFWSKNDVRVA